MIGFLVALGLLVAVALIYLASLKGDYEVRRSVSINAAPQAVFDRIRDLRGWKDWSPWLMHEPDTRLEFSEAADEEGGTYSWDGDYIGAGRLIHEHFEAPQRIEQRIEFTRPFRSVCRVAWEIEAQGEATRVSWIMQGHMPFFLRFMTARLKDMIGKDYELGLAMLNGVLDADAERPLIEFVGDTLLEPWACLSKPWSGSLDGVATVMAETFPRIIAAAGDGLHGAPFSAYHKVDPKTRAVDCEMAVPVTEGVDSAEFERRELGGGRYFKVTQQGDYRFLELTWYAAMAHLKMYKLRYDSSRPALEVYENDPTAVAHSNELRTTLYLPLR